MIYSVWNKDSNLYDYYEGQGALGSGVFAPSLPRRSGHKLGLTPEEAARKLPRAARKLGSGPVAQGLVASKEALGFFGDTDTLIRLAVFGLVGYLVWTRVLSPEQQTRVKSKLRSK